MEKAWWQTGVVYEVYPRSFQDTDGDGVGDLPGIERRLDHLAWLGVDAVWIAPFYPSPMCDFGYDVADYTGVDPLFGTTDDFDRLLAAAHDRGIRVIVDLVPNHTSSEHPWFRESRTSRGSPRRDWYLWRDPAPDGGPPNNWLAAFGGSAWTLDEETGQYYHHAFLPEQPDLNWRNPQVARAVGEEMRWWLDRGVDGFRVDVVWHLMKDPLLRDNPVNPDHDPGRDPASDALVPAFSADQPEVHDAIAQLRAVVDEYADPERILIGEAYLPIGRLVTYYGGGGRPGVHLPFNFHLVTSPWKAREIDAVVAEYEGALPRGAWPNWVLGNHDQPRVATRVGRAQARVAAMLLLTLRGTPTLYYGDEIGMTDGEIPPDRVRDPQAKGGGRNRDPARTPMQWDSSPMAGFTDGDEAWLPLAEGYDEVNVAAQKEDPRSILHLHRRLIHLRRDEPALCTGEFFPVIGEGETCLAYVREDRDGEGGRFLVALNLGGEPATFRPERWPIRGAVVLSTHLDREEEEVRGAVELRGDEGVVVRLADGSR